MTQLLAELVISCNDAQVVNVYGANGVGKTTILRKLSERLRGADRRNTNYVSPAGLEQFRFRLPETSIADHAFALGKNWIETRKSIIERLSCAVDNPDTLLAQPLQNLSTGQVKFIALAIAIEFRSQTLLIDEPFRHLHSDLKPVVSQWIEDAAKDTTVICATHEQMSQANREFQIKSESSKNASIANFLESVVEMSPKVERNHLKFRLCGSTQKSPTTIHCKAVPMMRAGWSRCLNMDFTISHGEVLYVDGANGSGKSTLLRTLGGLRSPKAGNILLNDIPIYPKYRLTNGVKRFGNIKPGHLLQSLVGDHKTSEEAVTLLRSSIAISNAFSDTVGHNSWQDAYTNLSSGEGALLRLTAVLMHRPNIMFLDEAFAGFSNEWTKSAIETLVTFATRWNLSAVFVQHLENVTVLPETIRRVNL